MKFRCTCRENKLPIKRILLPGIISLGLGWISISSAQAADSFIREAETIENDELKAFGISNPVGLTFSPKAENLLILEEPEASVEETEITAISLEEGDSSTPVTIPAEIPDPINTVFDSTQNRLLAIDSQTDNLVEVAANSRGELKEQETATTERSVSDALSLNEPQGMTTDPETGFVYILDSGKVVLVKPLNEGGLTTIDEVALPPEVGDPKNLRGIAFNPNDDLIYVYNLNRQKLYGVTKSGDLESTRDLSEFGLSSTQSMIFAPSGDSTDDPGQMSLYIVDQGLADNETRTQARAARATAIIPESEVNNTVEVEDSTPESRIIELSLVKPPALQATASMGSLIQVMDLSQLDNPHFPASSTLLQLGTPDPSGITYLPATNSVLIVDGEVEEITGAPSNRYNVFEVDYNLSVADINRLVDVFTIVTVPFINAQFGPKFSTEPTGISAVNPDNGHVFISDDDPTPTNNLQSIFEVAPGPDGTFATPDDVVDTFVLIDLTPGGIKDPEGIAYGEVSPGQKRIFIAGGIDHEIYWVNLGTNGILDITDPVAQFDTFAHGLLDPEGIEFDSDTGHLYVTGEPIDQIFEFQVDGTFVRTIDISAALPGASDVPSGLGLVQPAGLILAPGTDGSQRNLYIVDRGVDNDGDPTENDGQLFEINIGKSSVVGNQSPIAVNDTVAAQQNTAVNGNVLDGSLSSSTPDSDPDGNPIQVSSNTVPGNGTLASGVAANGNFTYTPNTGYTGPDSFDYTISDGQGGSATATVNIQVQSVDGNQTISSQVATGSDDAEEKDISGSVTTNNGDLDLTESGGGTQTTGIRFLPTIPPGATIVSASIQFTADEVRSSATLLTFKGQSSSNAPTFTPANGSISARATTGTSVAWSSIPSWNNIGDAGAAQRTPDLSSIIQEIVNGSGWSSGNGLAIIITGIGKRPAETYDADPAKAAVLHVEYSTGSSGGNQNPNAVNDNATTQQDTAVNGNVLNGSLSGGTADSDPDGDSIQVNSNTTPGNGTLTSGVTASGNFTYTPNTGYTGTDSFNYTISDGQGGTDTATVNIQVQSGGGNQTISSQVATSSDDAEEKDSSGNVTTNNGDLDLTESGGGTQTMGIRFLPAIPSGATIVSASIQFTADEVRSSATSLTFKGQSSSNAPTFTSANGSISARATTGSSVIWSSVPSWNNIGDAGAAQRTPDLSSIIQEIVNGSGWSSGNGLAIIITGTGKRPAETYDADPTKAAVLHVEYSMTQSISSQVATSSDDAEEKDSSGSVTTNNGDLDLTESGGGTQTTGIRFLPAIPSGATIVSASIQFTADEVRSSATSLTFKGQNSSNAPTFTSANGSISARATTGSSVTWSSIPSWNNIGDAGAAQRTPDMSSIIQEIVNGSGWSNGNGLVIIITGTGKRPAETFDADPAKAAVLHVEYQL